MDIGINKKDRKQIADGLSRLLADSFTLYLKTHNFHWNVTGPMFNTLHVMFMDQYTELWNALDMIAERIRALGVAAPGTYREFAKLTVIKESEGKVSADGHDQAIGCRSGSGHQDRTRHLPDCRQGGRRTDRRPADPAHADPRKECLDAAQPARGMIPLAA